MRSNLNAFEYIGLRCTVTLVSIFFVTDVVAQ